MRTPKILMIAFHFPPFVGGSGINRTLKFVRYLPERGWDPIVLSAHPRAYPVIGSEQLEEIPPHVPVRRAFAFDSSRHLGIRGTYFKCTAIPDRWVTWWFGAVTAGLSLIRQYRPDVIWSTYPIATAHMIGMTLSRLTGIPWVADLRDSMTEDGYPADRLTRACYLWIEKRVMRFSTKIIFTTEGTKRMYQQRYPDVEADKCIVLPNGYDEEDFRCIDSVIQMPLVEGRLLRVLHAGVIYPYERDPRPFFRALARLKREGHLSPDRLRVDLRATGHDAYYISLVKELGIEDLVYVLPPIPYQEALQDCAGADVLLLLQGGSCDHQVPAKVYEYLRLGRPILALTTEKGDTAQVLKHVGGAFIIDMADEAALYEQLPRFFALVQAGSFPLPERSKLKQFERRHQAHIFAEMLHRFFPNASVTRA